MKEKANWFQRKFEKKAINN